MLMLAVGLAIATCLFSGAAMRAGVLFSESFDDADLAKRDCADGARFRIVGDAWPGQGCIEYEWLGFGANVSGLRSTDFPAMKFNQFLMTPYFGPGLLPHAQKLWIDELAVGTNRIGPLPASKTCAGEKDSIQ
jgi:hypothetical protein